MAQRLPLVFACSGCSRAGRLAYDLAQEFDRQQIAEMSCLAGVGAAKAYFLKQLRGREVWIIDGCPIECSLGVFEQVGQAADAHIRLHQLGVRKSTGAPTGVSGDRLMAASLEQVEAQRTRRIGRTVPSPARAVSKRRSERSSTANPSLESDA